MHYLKEKAMNQKLTGIYAALFTPFDKDGKIMYDALQRHVDNLVNQGLDGFYVNGSTGESFLMTNEERKKAHPSLRGILLEKLNC